MDRREFLQASAALTGGLVVGSTLLEEEADAAATRIVARLKIPRIRFDKPVYNGTDKVTLDKGGLGHWLGTAAPGARGNCMLFGHRTAAGGPLRYLNTLRVGDSIQLAGYTYKVDSKLILPSSQVIKAIDWNPGKRRGIQLLACTKPNGQPTSLSYRYIVRAIA